MEADIAQGKIGEVAEYDLEFKEGALQFVIKAEHGIGPVSASGQIVIKIGVEALGAVIKKAIPGQFDDLAVDLVLNALKK